MVELLGSIAVSILIVSTAVVAALEIMALLARQRYIRRAYNALGTLKRLESKADDMLRAMDFPELAEPLARRPYASLVIIHSWYGQSGNSRVWEPAIDARARSVLAPLYETGRVLMRTPLGLVETAMETRVQGKRRIGPGGKKDDMKVRIHVSPRDQTDHLVDMLDALVRTRDFE